MYIAGGTSSKSHRRRFYHVLPHEMIQLDNLPFDFGHGTCKGEVGPESKVSDKILLGNQNRSLGFILLCRARNERLLVLG